MRSRPALLATSFAAAALVVSACSAGAATRATDVADAAASPPGATGSTSATPGSANSGSATAPEQNPAGDIPDSQAFVEVVPAGQSYAVKVPEGWARSAAAGAVTFTDKLNSIRLETLPTPAAPSRDSARAAELPAIAGSVPAYKAGDVTTVTRKAGPAVLVTYQADGTPNTVTGKVVRLAIERYEFWRAGQEVVVTVSGPVGADNVDPWKTVTDSFRWTA